MVVSKNCVCWVRGYSGKGNLLLELICRRRTSPWLGIRRIEGETHLGMFESMELRRESQDIDRRGLGPYEGSRPYSGRVEEGSRSFWSVTFSIKEKYI